MNHIHWLDDAPSGARLGGKGDSLARLLRAGFDVPPGFVLAPDAFTGMTGAAWPDDLDVALREAWQRLAPGGEAVAVRSSALDEDSAGASFAGQHETLLNVTGFDALKEAVAACVASLHSESAAAYRARAEPTDEAAMAVVVQRMVDAAAAGVAFSTDPTGARAGVVVIEAVRGLGDRLVGGQEEGERYLVDRDSLAVVERPAVDRPALEDQAAIAVARAALRSEEHFGAPQDIEFAFDRDGKLWLLQSRPITGVGEGATGWRSEFDSDTGPDERWTSANIQEVLPGLLTPLTITSGRRNSQLGFTEGYRRVGLIGRDEDPPWIGFFYSRAFLNIDTTRRLAERAVGGAGDDVENQYLGGEPVTGTEPEPLRNRLPYMARSLWPLAKLLFTAQQRSDRFLRHTLAAERRVNALDLAALDNAEIAGWLLRCERFAGRVFAHHLHASGLASTGYTNLARVLQPLLGDETGSTMATLLSGLKNVESARISVDLWNLSRVAVQTGMAEQVRDPAFDPDAPDLPAGWRAAYRSFMHRHGHRGMQEMEAARTWRRDPRPVLSTVRAYVDMNETRSPVATLERQEQERLELTESLAARMNPLRRVLFRRFVRDAQANVAMREQTKSTIVRAARMTDPLIAEAARRLVALGAIDAEDDTFFLAYEEVQDLLQGRVESPHFQEAVARRRREFERNRHVELPERFTGRPEPLAEPPSDAARVLTGLGVSRGAVTGRARVIRDPATDGPLQPGEILVAPVTDAGWTPLFGLASGLVVDMGSALSHGSTVAREYGLPAVVNVRNATRTIRDGDLVHIDGSTGTVSILDDEPAT